MRAQRMQVQKLQIGDRARSNEVSALRQIYPSRSFNRVDLGRFHSTHSLNAASTIETQFGVDGSCATRRRNAPNCSCHKLLLRGGGQCKLQQSDWIKLRSFSDA